MKGKVGIGVIGAMGRGAFLGGIFNATGKAEVRAVADINAQSFEVGKERYAAHGANPDLYTDVAQMLKRDDLDWVIVGTPDRTHYELARQAILAGRNVIVEKPLTQNTRDADKLGLLVAERRVKLIVGFELRYTSLAENFRKAIRQGKIGRPVIGMVIDHLGRGYSYFLRDHRKKKWGRGLLMQKGVHSLDLANDFSDSRPTRVFGSGGLDFYGRRQEFAGRHCRDCKRLKSCEFSFDTVDSPTWKKGGPRDKDEHAFDHCVFMPDTDAEDNMHLLVDYESGFRLSYTAVFFAPVYNRHEYYFWGTEGSLRGVMETNRDSLTFAPVGGAREAEETALPIEIADDGHGGGDTRFVNAIVQATFDNVGIHPDVWDGREAVALAEFGQKSIETGLPQRIPPRPAAKA